MLNNYREHDYKWIYLQPNLVIIDLPPIAQSFEMIFSQIQ